MRIENLELTFASEAKFNKALDAVDRTFSSEVLESLEAEQVKLAYGHTYWRIKFNEPIIVGHFKNLIERINEQR
jgi:hypothetical protein|nr:MAG TPA: hypothetical protein [Caudoviricetes sp.]